MHNHWYNTILAAHTHHNELNFTPSLEIGNNVNIGQSSNISCINHIKIGDGVFMGRRVMLNDNSHGTFEHDMLDIQLNLCALWYQRVLLLLTKMGG